MRKLIVLLAFLPASAFAQVTVSYLYGLKHLQPSGQSHQNSLTLIAPVMNHFAVDGGIIDDTNDKTKVITARYELGLDFDQKFLDNYAATLRTAVGEKQKSGTQMTSYYVIEPGINAALPYGFSARIAYRYRDAFNPANKDKSNTMRYAIGYNVTEKDKITFGYDVQRGDGANTMTSVKYSRTF